MRPTELHQVYGKQIV